MVQEFQAQENRLIIALIFATVFLVIASVGVVLFFYFSRKKVIEKEREKADLKIKNQQRILQTSIAVQETERKRIAQDLHDAISAKLNVVSLTTNVLLANKNNTDKQQEALNHILNITTTTLESSRKIAHDLMPPILEKFGLKAALEELFEEFTKTTNVEIEHNVEELQLSETNQLHVFRILQELINNSIRHGKANELIVFIDQDTQGFSLQYQDNGIGFNVLEVSKKSGIGLQNINSRVKILNGSLQIESKENSGSQFIIRGKYES